MPEHHDFQATVDSVQRFYRSTLELGIRVLRSAAAEVNSVETSPAKSASKLDADRILLSCI